MIGAIQTNYKGFRFRSRLEARWAVFFDWLGIEWKYEIEGFQKGDFLYLPDFYLPKSKLWVEVKGSDEMLAEKSDSLENFLDWGCPLPDFDDSHQNMGRVDGGFLILGDIPYCNEFGIFLHRLVTHHKGLIFSWAMFCPSHLRLMDCNLLEFFEPDGGYKDWTTECRHIPTCRNFPVVAEAYAKARSARFEYGEQG